MNISWNSLSQAFYALPCINKSNLGKLSHHMATVLKTFASHIQHNANSRGVAMMGLSLVTATVVDKLVTSTFKLFNYDQNKESKGLSLLLAVRYSVITSCVLLGNLALNRMANLNLSRFIIAASVTASLAVYYLYREIIIPDVFSDENQKENDQDLPKLAEEKLEQAIPQVQLPVKREFEDKPELEKKIENLKEVEHREPQQDLKENEQLAESEFPREVKEEHSDADCEADIEAKKQKADAKQEEPAINKLHSDSQQQEQALLLNEDNGENSDDNALLETEPSRHDPAPEYVEDKGEVAEKESLEPNLIIERNEEGIEEELSSKQEQTELSIVESNEEVLEEENKKESLEEEPFSKPGLKEPEIVEIEEDIIEEENKEEVEEELYSNTAQQAILYNKSQPEPDAERRNTQEPIAERGEEIQKKEAKLEENDQDLATSGDFVKVADLTMSADSISNFLAGAIKETNIYNPSANK